MSKRKAKEREDASASTECTICLSNDSLDIGNLACRHSFCFECIENWSEHENSCPLCKKRFTYIDRITKEPNNGSSKPPTKLRVKIKKKNQADYEPQAAPNPFNHGFDIGNMVNFISAHVGSRMHPRYGDIFALMHGGFGYDEEEQPFGQRTASTGRIARTRTMQPVRRTASAPTQPYGGRVRGAVVSRSSNEPIEISDDEEVPVRAASSSSASFAPTEASRPQGSSSAEVIDLTDDAAEYTPSASALLGGSFSERAAAITQVRSAMPSALPAGLMNGTASMEEVQNFMELLEDELDEDYDPSMQSHSQQDEESLRSELSTDNEEEGDENEMEFGTDFEEEYGADGFRELVNSRRVPSEVIDLIDDEDDNWVVARTTSANRAAAAATQSAAQTGAQAAPQVQPSSVVVAEGSTSAITSAPSRTNSANSADTAATANRPSAPVRPYAGVMVWCRSCDAYHDKQRVWEEPAYCRATYANLLSTGCFGELSQVSDVTSGAVSSSSSSNGGAQTTVTDADVASASRSASVPAAASNSDLVDLMDASSDESYDYLSNVHLKRIRRSRDQSPIRRVRSVPSSVASSTEVAASNENLSASNVGDKESEGLKVTIAERVSECASDSDLIRTQSDATTIASSRSRSPAASSHHRNLSLLAEASRLKRAASVSAEDPQVDDSSAKRMRLRTTSLSESPSNIGVM